MTLEATKQADTATIRPYPLENTWAKGHYLARLTGPHDRYVVDRDFLTGTPNKGRGIVAYVPDDIGTVPAWLIRSGATCGGCGRPNPDQIELIAAYGHAWQIVGEGYTSRDLLNIWESGPPGTNPEQQAAQATEPDRVPVYAADKEDPF